ncbi:MAG: glycerol-3-phosphate acyltransferase [Bacteroidota bacterium]
MIPAFAFVIGYFFGSIPTAYLIVRRRSGVDIRNVGSGNVGGYNAATVTGSTGTGVTVGLLDGLKGLLTSLGAWFMAPGDPVIQYAAVAGAIIGHNYPVWLRFKGGRGLATAAGALFGIGVFYTAAWTLSWVALYRWTKDILRSNLGATAIALALTWVVPAAAVEFLLIRPQPAGPYTLFVTVLSVIIVVSHAEAFRTFSKSPETPTS